MLHSGSNGQLVFNQFTLEMLNLLYEMMRFNLIIDKNEQISPFQKKSIFRKKTIFSSDKVIENKNTYLEDIILYLSPLLDFEENYNKIIHQINKSPLKLSFY
jgi:hypothetical protein